MTSYGHGYGFAPQNGMFEYSIINIMFLIFVVCIVFWFFIKQTICSTKTINRPETNFYLFLTTCSVGIVLSGIFFLCFCRQLFVVNRTNLYGKYIVLLKSITITINMQFKLRYQYITHTYYIKIDDQTQFIQALQPIR